MLKLKLQYFDHLMRRADSFEKTLMLGKIEGRRRRGQQRMRWLDGITDSMDINLSKLQQGWLACCSPWGCKKSGMTQRLNNNSHLYNLFSIDLWIHFIIHFPRNTGLSCTLSSQLNSIDLSSFLPVYWQIPYCFYCYSCVTWLDISQGKFLSSLFSFKVDLAMCLFFQKC